MFPLFFIHSMKSSSLGSGDKASEEGKAAASTDQHHEAVARRVEGVAGLPGADALVPRGDHDNDSTPQAARAWHGTPWPAPSVDDDSGHQDRAAAPASVLMPGPPSAAGGMAATRQRPVSVAPRPSSPSQVLGQASDADAAVPLRPDATAASIARPAAAGGGAAAIVPVSPMLAAAAAAAALKNAAAFMGLPAARSAAPSNAAATHGSDEVPGLRQPGAAAANAPLMTCAACHAPTTSAMMLSGQALALCSQCTGAMQGILSRGSSSSSLLSNQFLSAQQAGGPRLGPLLIPAAPSAAVSFPAFGVGPSAAAHLPLPQPSFTGSSGGVMDPRGDVDQKQQLMQMHLQMSASLPGAGSSVGGRLPAAASSFAHVPDMVGGAARQPPAMMTAAPSATAVAPSAPAAGHAPSPSLVGAYPALHAAGGLAGYGLPGTVAGAGPYSAYAIPPHMQLQQLPLPPTASGLSLGAGVSSSPASTAAMHYHFGQDLGLAGGASLMDYASSFLAGGGLLPPSATFASASAAAQAAAAMVAALSSANYHQRPMVASEQHVQQHMSSMAAASAAHAAAAMAAAAQQPQLVPATAAPASDSGPSRGNDHSYATHMSSRRSCVDCNAVETSQWRRREGDTICSACYFRLLRKKKNAAAMAAHHAATAGGPLPGMGLGPTGSRQQDGVAGQIQKRARRE